MSNTMQPGGNTRNTDCVVCRHRDQEAIDTALVLGQRTAADVARELGVHRSTVTRHLARHMLPEMREKLAQDENMATINVIDELKQLYVRMKRHLERAEQSNNWQVIRAFHSEARQDLELLAKLLGDLQQEGTVNVHLSAEWVHIRTTLMLALAPYPEARVAAAAALLELDNERA